MSNISFCVVSQTLLTDIKAYRIQLEQVRELGQQLIVTSGHLPQLVQQTESQLTNMDDSYMSLTSTAAQIKVSVGSLFNSLVVSVWRCFLCSAPEW